MIPKICIELRIMGDNFDPNNFSKIIDIIPTEKWRKGSSSKNYEKAINQYDCWLFSTGYKEVYNSDEILREIYQKFGIKKKIIKNIVEESNLEVSLDIIVEMPKDQTPGLSFDKEIISFLNYIGAKIDIDMYII